ncbi:hypothetical protein [Candidatus Poriferisocius sp.]|uniref:hypothetical protein n=1 Tax=Candidatus Poriferisocius sp. TaxID=3101276 RepID=UPI003B02BCFD
MSRSELAPVVEEVVGKAIERLRECPDFTAPKREQITPIITSAIRFLARCLDEQEGGSSGRTAYLFDPDADEDDLRTDLVDWFKGNGLYGMYREPQNIGGGRPDITFAFNEFRFVIELKRELVDATEPSLGRYLRQPAAYLAADIAVGMLIVLDLSSGPLAAHIRDNVWVDRLESPEPEGTDRCFLVIRVPGNRKSPSRLLSATNRELREQ